jgi:hypothetical protein
MKNKNAYEALEKAGHDIAFTVADLRDVLGGCSACESIIITELIETAAKLAVKISNFRDFYSLDHAPGGDHG